MNWVLKCRNFQITFVFLAIFAASASAFGYGLLGGGGYGGYGGYPGIKKSWKCDGISCAKKTFKLSEK